MSLHPVTVTFPSTINDVQQVHRMKDLGQHVQVVNQETKVLPKFGVTRLSVSKAKLRSCHVSFAYESDKAQGTAEGEVFLRKAQVTAVVHDRTGVVRQHFERRGQTVKEFLEETFKPIFAPKATDKAQTKKEVKRTGEHPSNGFRHSHSTDGDEGRAVNDNNGILTNAEGEALAVQN